MAGGHVGNGDCLRNDLHAALHETERASNRSGRFHERWDWTIQCVRNRAQQFGFALLNHTVGPNDAEDESDTVNGSKAEPS